MKLCTTRFALAAATTMMLYSAIKRLIWRPFICKMPAFKGMVWKYHCGFGAKYLPTTLKETLPGAYPWHFMLIKIAIVFVITFALVLFFSWFYNKLICDDCKK